jgi:hypothetical protein
MSTVPANFQSLSASISKQPVIVVEIAGLSDILSSATVFTRINYGDPVVKYGGHDEDGKSWVYGGLRRYTAADGGITRPYLILDSSSLAITQKVEQEQGRCSISQMSLTFIDKDSYMSKLISPGILIPEPLGAEVRVYLGYQEISWPQDYITIFRGNIQGYTSQAGKVTLQLGDPNLRKRQSLFFTASTELAGGITAVDTTINVVNNGDFYQQILGPNGIADPNVKTYIFIDSEWIEYSRTAYRPNSFNQSAGGTITRGARGTTADVHDAGATVTAGIEFGGNAVDIILKLMLSGWNGPYRSAQPIAGLVTSGDPDIGDITDGIILPTGIDAVEDLGLSPGDYITISGDPNPSNNVTGIVGSFQDVLGNPNNAIIIDQPLIASSPSVALLALRSQYDTFPDGAGLKLFPYEVDVQAHQRLKAGFISDTMLFFITASEDNAKAFIEKELALPVSAYCLTVSGKISLKITLPPIANQVPLTLDASNVIQPAQIRVERSTTTRRFFNEIQYSYNPDDSGNFQNFLAFLDTDSLNEIGYSSTMPIETKGTRSGANITVRAKRLLDRYKRGAVVVYLSVNFGTGNNVNPGDIVLLKDNGQLQISNFATGQRNLGSQLYEVIERTFDFQAGNTKLTLLSGLNFGLQDRFATWGPGSLIQAAGSNTTTLKIIPSFGALFGISEYKKWTNYIGLNVRIHSYDFTYDHTSILRGVSSSNVLTLSPALPSVPLDNYIIDLAPYSTSTDPSDQEIAKGLHVSWDKTAAVVSGISSTQFTVSSGDAQYFRVGYPLRVHTSDWVTDSPEVLITDVTGTTITCADLGFTPAAGYKCDLLSFPDAGQPYRWT